MSLISRRRALTWGAGAAATLLLGEAGCGHPEDSRRQYMVSGEQGLATRARARGFLFGAATMADHLDLDPVHAAALVRECGVLVSQNELKWAIIRPAPDKFDFRRPDRLAVFAAKHNLAFRGHALLWHISNPRWLPEALATGDALSLMTDHIWAVAGRYRGRMQSWDVVNEAIEVSDGRPDGLRKTEWLAALGPGYIEAAFHLAAAADPSSQLVYNDYGLDYADDNTAAKRDAVLELLQRLKSKGAPVHALGIQAHLRPGRRFDPLSMSRFLDDAARLGLDIYITELEVNDINLPRRIRVRDVRSADAVLIYLETVLAHPAVKLVATWGLSDKYTFRNEPEFKRWGWTNRPLPLDTAMQRKPMWHAMARAFDDAPPRPLTAIG